MLEYSKKLGYQLLKDTFSVLGSSKWNVLSVFDLKDAFHFLRLLENSKDIVESYCVLVVLHIYIEECPWD